MRDVVMKSLTSRDHRKRQLRLKEFTQAGGYNITTKKCWHYAIKDSSNIKNTKRLKSWLKRHTAGRPSASLKSLHVTRKLNRRTGENRFGCKTAGDLFVINDSRIFAVRFFYSFSIEMDSVSVPC